MTPAVVLLIFIAQGLVLGADEIVFHRVRGLPAWERRGHPIDTFSVLMCLAIALTLPARQPWIGWYWGMAIASCLCVTKDEWVHSRFCTPGEQWLHTLLFLLHPALLGGVYLLWKSGEGSFLLKIEFLLCGLFMLYQIFYWNFLRSEKAGA